MLSTNTFERGGSRHPQPAAGRVGLRWRTHLLAALWLLATVSATACGGSKADPASGTGAGQTAQEPVRGGTVVLATTSGPAGVNDLLYVAETPTREVLSMMFLHLVQEQPDFTEHPPTFKPQLAERWEFSEDHRSLTFHLRDDITWSDGIPVTADDVRFTWQAQTNPDVAWPAAFYKTPIRDVVVVDPHTVRFDFHETFANQLLYANEGQILPKHAWGELPFEQWHGNADWFREHLVVDGPFELASWRSEEEIRLRRNERYYESGLPYLDEVVIRVVPDRATQLVQLESGTVDFISGLSPDDARRVQQSPELELSNYWSRGYAFVAWNHRRPLFRNANVRRALTLAINRQVIVDTLWGSYGKLAASPVVSSVWAYNDAIQPLPYDPQEATRLLAAEGWSDHDGDGVLDKDGEPFAFDLITNLGNQQRMDAIVMVQEQLARIGIAVTPRNISWPTLSSEVTAGNYDAVLLKLNMATDLDLSIFHSRGISDGTNFFGYSNPEVDEAIDQAARVDEVAALKPYLDRVQAAIDRDQALTFIWESQLIGAQTRRLHGTQPNLLRNYWDIEHWWMEPAG
jgi:peptide/nickel transport system substrate-binding protein